MCKTHEFAAVFYFRNSLPSPQLIGLSKDACGDSACRGGIMKLSRRLAVAGAVLASTVVAAQAADMPLKAPPIVAVPFSWTGAYVGVNVGAVRGNANYDPICAGAITAACPVLIPPTLQNIPGIGLLIIPGAFSGLPGASARNTSFMGGVQAGYNWQVNQIVLGVEGDIDGTHIHASLTRGAIPPFAGFPVAVTATSTDTIDWIASARARAGVVVAERGLLYVTGGAAFTNAKVNTAFGETFGPLVIPPFFPPPTGASSSHGLVGWTLGGGVEWAFSKAWSLAAEYRHNDFGGQNYLLGTDVVGNPIMDRVKFTTDQVTLRLNWRFAAH
jgi:outer membrane immunogenic protein